jgi:hypothetical protein
LKGGFGSAANAKNALALRKPSVSIFNLRHLVNFRKMRGVTAQSFELLEAVEIFERVRLSFFFAFSGLTKI